MLLVAEAPIAAVVQMIIDSLPHSRQFHLIEQGRHPFEETRMIVVIVFNADDLVTEAPGQSGQQVQAERVSLPFLRQAVYHVLIAMIFVLLRPVVDHDPLIGLQGLPSDEPFEQGERGRSISGACEDREHDDLNRVMTALITNARATELIPNWNTADNSIMTDCVAAASNVVQRWCNRDFVTTSYDELYDGTGHHNLLLNQYPIISITRVLWNPVQVLMISNNATAVSRASFRLDGTTASPPVPQYLYLTSVASGVTTTTQIGPLATGALLTYADLAAAINTYSANGWSATALGPYSTWALADLRPPQGGSEVRWYGAAYLYQHTFGLPAFNQNPDVGEIVTGGGFCRGYQNYRVIYSAGYSTVPDAVQQATAAIAAAIYTGRGINPNLQSESLGGYSYSILAEKSFANLDIASRYGLYLYKNTRVPKFRAW